MSTTRTIISWSRILVLALACAAILSVSARAEAGETSNNYNPAIASGTQGSLIVWEGFSGVGRILAARMDTAGHILDRSGFQITADGSRPTVASLGANYLVAWQMYSGEIRAARVTSTGAVLDPDGFALPTSGGNKAVEIAVSSNGQNYLVVWPRGESIIGSPTDIVGMRISSAGELLDTTPFWITNDGYSSLQTSVASDGDGFFVAWENVREASVTGMQRIYGARVAADGTVIDANGLPMDAGPAFADSPDVAWSPQAQRYVVTWFDLYREYQVKAVRVAPNGVIGPLTVVDATHGAAPAAASNGSDVAILWGRGDSTGRGTKMNSDGLVRDLGGVELPVGGYGWDLSWDQSSYILVMSDRSDIFAARFTSDIEPLDGSGILVSEEVSIDTIIDTKPAALANSSAATFTFHATEPNPTFECRLDSAEWSACTSPNTVADLTEGAHGFEVRASVGSVTDPTPATADWTVDTIAPETGWTASPAHGSVTKSSVTFGFGSNETATFECSMDFEAFAPCSTPKSYSGLADGAHTFRARAIDAAGNVDASPVGREWFVDGTAPETVLTSGPADDAVTSSSVSFGFDADELATFECSLDLATFTACASPRTYSGLADGQHTFRARAIDAVGNVDLTPVGRSWFVDTSTPAPRLSVASSLGFGTARVGDTTSKTLSARNTGTAALTISSVQVSDVSEFAVASDGCSGVALAPGASCSIGVRFSPATAGLRSAELTISSPDVLPARVALVGLGDAEKPRSTVDVGFGIFVYPLSLSGTASDDAAGISKVIVTFSSVTGTDTRQGSLTCSVPTSCTWSVRVPVIPGVYQVSSRATDNVGRVEDAATPQTIVVL